MLVTSPAEMLEEVSALTSKLNKGFEVLRQIDALEVGTTPKEKVWQRDKVALYHYTRETPHPIQTPVLLVYALVNRHNMMDIQPDRSFIRNLQASGLDLYLIDWGYPTPEDRYYTMQEYIGGYINDAVGIMLQRTRKNAITIMGIC